MTDETDADSDRNTEEKSRATVHATTGSGSDKSFIVEYPDGELAYEPATPENRALFEDDLYELVDGTSTFAGPDGEPVVFHGDVQSGEYSIEYGNMVVSLGRDELTDAFDALRSFEQGVALVGMFEEMVEGAARVDVLGEFRDDFPEDRVDVTMSGWVVDDTFLVDYDGKNWLVNGTETYRVTGGGVTKTDGNDQAIEFDFGITDPRTVFNGAGEGFELEPVEQRFLMTVEALLYPGDYFGVELVDEVESRRAEAMQTDLSGLLEQATVETFTDTKTGVRHRHGFDKHRACREVARGTLDNELGVTPEVVDRMYFHDYDHAAPWELLARYDEFVNAPFDVFTDDVPDDDVAHWRAVVTGKNSAPIGQDNEEQIRRMFGEWGETEQRIKEQYSEEY